MRKSAAQVVGSTFRIGQLFLSTGRERQGPEEPAGKKSTKRWKRGKRE
jgi:hypothetical protein